MAILILLLAACSGGETSGGKEEPAKDNGADAEEVAKVEDEEVAEDEVTYDLGGRVIRITNHWDMTPVGGTEIGDLKMERWAEVEEKYNVKVEFTEIPYEEKINQLTSTILAGEPMADIVGVDSNEAASLVQQDYVFALEDIIDVSSSKMTDAMKDMGMFNGKLHLFRNEMLESGGLYYNKTMFEQAGLPDPYELQEAGEWTWEAMLDAAKKLTTGTQFGLGADPAMLGEYLIFSNGAQLLDTDTGEVTFDSPEAMEGLEFMSALINEHKVYKQNEGSNWNDPRQYFNEGLIAMTQGWTWEAEPRLELPFEWGYVFWPKGPNATDHVTPVSNSSGLVIPKGVKDPEIVYQIWEDMQLWELEEEGVIEHFEKILPNEGSVKTALEGLENLHINYWPSYGLHYTLWGTFENIAKGTESPAQAITKIKDEAQAHVDEFLGK